MMIVIVQEVERSFCTNSINNKYKNNLINEEFSYLDNQVYHLYLHQPK
jgi:hypothetical protein